MKKLNVAIIGQGRSGRNIHGQYFLTEGGKKLFNVVAVVDWMEERRNRAKDEFNCDVYEDYRELFNRDDIDVVVNSTFSYEHYPITMDLLEHKLNVVVEKPFSKYAMECENMIEAAKKNDVMLCVFQQSRFATYYTKLKEVLSTGKLGKIQEIKFRNNGFARRWDWQCSHRFYAGSMLNTGPHPFDQALDLLDLDVDDMPNVFSVLNKVHSRGDAEDCVKVILTYPEKPLIDIEINSTDAYCDYVIAVLAEKGSVKLSRTKLKWKYHNDKPIPEFKLEPLCLEDGISPSYCSEKLEWKEFEEDLVGDAFDVGTAKYYENIYNHLVNGEELVIDPRRVTQQIRVMELVHAQNPMKATCGLEETK